MPELVTYKNGIVDGVDYDGINIRLFSIVRDQNLELQNLNIFKNNSSDAIALNSTNLENLEARVVSVEGSVNGLDTSALEIEVTENTENINNLLSNISSLEDRVAKLENQMTSINIDNPNLSIGDLEI